MKIGLISRHEGWINFAKQMFEGYDFVVYETHNVHTIEGKEDLYIMNNPGTDLKNLYPYDKPIILYPCMWECAEPEQGEVYRKIIETKKTRLILNQTVWSKAWHDLFPSKTQYYIPYALKDLPKWQGNLKRVFSNTTTPERLKCYTNKSYEEVIGGLDHYYQFTLSQKQMFNEMKQSAVFFYFSNAPWTLAFAEAITMGIPIVTVNEHITGDLANIACPIEKIAENLKLIIDNPDLAQEYHERNLWLADRIANYDLARKDWDKHIKEML